MDGSVTPALSTHCSSCLVLSFGSMVSAQCAIGTDGGYVGCGVTLGGKKNQRLRPNNCSAHPSAWK
jgi:hypothetical protein